MDSKTYIDKLAWIYIEDKKILCTRTKCKDVYYIPGGKRESGESDIEALVREVKEELTVDIVTDSIKAVGVFEAQAHGKPEGVMVRMTCYSSDYTGAIKPAAEIEEVAWFTYADKGKTSPVSYLLFDFLKEKDLIE